MAKFHHYLNFNGNTEEAFLFYQSIFGGEFEGGIMRFKDMPEEEGMSAEDKEKVMHIGMSLGDGLYLMGNDCLESFGQKVIFGTNQYICVSPDTEEDARLWFAKLAEGGTVQAALEPQFWAKLYGSLTDKFGVQWMVNLD